MKKFKFLAVVFTALVMGLGIYSCTKDDILKQNGTDLNVEYRTDAGSFSVSSFYEQSDEFQNDPTMRLGCGISILINNDVSIKNLLLNEFVSCGYHEVLLHDFINPVKNPTIYDALVEKIDNLFPGDNTAVFELLDECSLMSLYMPSEYVEEFNSNSNLFVPVNSTFSLTAETYSFFGDEVADYDDYFGVILRSAQEYLFYNESTNQILGCELPFEEVFLFNLSDCDIVGEYINNQKNCNGYKMISFLEIYELFNGCIIQDPSDPDNGEDDGNDNNPDPNVTWRTDCDRGNIEMNLLFPELTTNTNEFTGLKVMSVDAFRLFDNQALPHAIFLFEMDWIINRDGAAWKADKYNVVVLRERIGRVQYEKVWGSHGSSGLGTTQGEIIAITPAVITISRQVFGTNPSYQHWRLDNQGDVIWVNIIERKVETTTSTTTTTQTYSYNVGGQINFEIPKVDDLTGELSFEYSHEIEHSVTITKEGVSIIDCGPVHFDYCEPYPYKNNFNGISGGPRAQPRWLQANNTGLIELHLTSAWE